MAQKAAQATRNEAVQRNSFSDNENLTLDHRIRNAHDGASREACFRTGI
jgi:hypothetical protein